MYVSLFFFLIFMFYRQLRRRLPVARLKSQIKSVTIGPVVFESRPSKVISGDLVTVHRGPFAA